MIFNECVNRAVNILQNSEVEMSICIKHTPTISSNDDTNIYLFNLYRSVRILAKKPFVPHTSTLNKNDWCHFAFEIIIKCTNLHAACSMHSTFANVVIYYLKIVDKKKNNAELPASSKLCLFIHTQYWRHRTKRQRLHTIWLLVLLKCYYDIQLVFTLRKKKLIWLNDKLDWQISIYVTTHTTILLSTYAENLDGWRQHSATQ